MKKTLGSFLLLALLLTTALPVPVFAEEIGTEVNADVESQVASGSERATQESVEEEGDAPIYANQIDNGDYDIDVKSSSSMFRIVECTLHVSDEKMTADITLSGTGYTKLFMGTGEEAVAAGKENESAFSEYTEDADGKYVFTVAVDALNTPLPCTGFSRRKEKWYDHEVSFRSELLPESAIHLNVEPFINSEAAEVETKEAVPTEEAKATETEADTEEVLPVVVTESVDIGDGTYLIPVTLTGGSGKASVQSPAKVTVKDGHATARLEWSSPNYDYMIVNGETYLPVNTEGNSVFEIPVLSFSAPFSVIADTTAMSQPHEITYELDFDLQNRTEAVSLDRSHLAAEVILVIFVILAIFVVVAIILAVKSRKQEKL